MGGEFVYELLCRLNDKIAAGVAVARTMGHYQYENCNPEHPTAIMTILGTEDYYNGIVYDGVTYYISADETNQYWADFNSTDNNPIEIELPDNSTNDGSSVTKRIWENGNSCVSVVELRVNGGGHDWPGSFGNMDISSDNEIWNFVSNFSVNGLIDQCNLDLEDYHNNVYSIFPNPVNNYLTINNPSEESSIKIKDLKGRLIHEITLVTGENIINLEMLSAGKYFIIFEDTVQKIIKN